MTPESLRILTVSEGFFCGGARFLHHAVLLGLQHAGHHSNILSINSSIEREHTVQPMEADASYQQLREAGVAITSLGRHATAEADFTPFSSAELDIFYEMASEADIILTLKEQPLRLTNQAEPLDTPLIACLHRSDPENQGRSLTELLLAQQTDRLALCTTSAQASKDAYVATGMDSALIEVILNGIDLVRFQHSDSKRDAVRRDLGVPRDAPLTLFGARYDFMKNVPLFLRSAREWLEANPEAHVVMCGAGMSADNPELQADIETQFAGALGLSDRVHLAGIQRDMSGMYSSADIVSSTSRTGETYPLCLLEGMACGAVAVATDIGDTRHMLEDELGIITPSDPQSIAAAWQQAYVSRADFADVIRQRRPTFDSQHMIAQYERVIRRVCEQATAQVAA